MNSLPARDRGAGSGMNTTFQNSAQVLSIGIFFTLIIVGLADSLPPALVHGLDGPRRPGRHRRLHLAPAAGGHPLRRLLGLQPRHPPARAARPGPAEPGQRATVTGEQFFPSLIGGAFRHGLHAALNFGIVTCLIGAAASWTRGGKAAPAEAVVLDDLVPEPAL